MINITLKQIAQDNQSGAAEILRRATEAICTLGALGQAGTPDALGTVMEISLAIVRAQPEMAALANLASAVVAAACATHSPDEIVPAAVAAARSFSDKAARDAEAALSRAASLINDGATILTHSRSSTVLAALKHARASQTRFSVIVTESRPMLEGRALAESLASRDINVTLIADAAAAVALKRADCVLVGADKVTPEYLVNKIGTRMIALAARELAVPVYAICDTSKFTAYSRADLPADQKNSDELWPDAPQGVEVFNSYFEPTPLDYFTGIITEEAVLEPEQARLRAEAMVMHKVLLDALDKGSL
jgi:translation initiation factor 2B subunit (eIF-2B alpha/beta/delta family)